MRLRRLTVAAALLLAGTGAGLGAEGLSLDGVRETLVHNGYTFQKQYDEVGQRWVFRVSKDGEGLLAIGNPRPTELDSPDSGDHLRIGLIHALVGTREQVAIELWTGGKNCCRIHWIIDTAPDLRVVLDTSAYHFDDLSLPRDIDGDGDIEFSFRTTSFDYFGASYADSPTVLAWFKFDRAAGHYIPANNACYEAIQEQTRDDEARLNALPAWAEYYRRRQLILNIVLAKLYAGHGLEAWSSLESGFGGLDSDELRVSILRRAESDPFYQALRRRGGAK